MVDIGGAAAATQSWELFNPLDIYKDSVLAKLVGVVPHMNSLSWLRSMKNRTGKRKVTNSTYSYYQEQQWFNASATIESITPNGAKFDIVLTADSHESLGGVANAGSFVVENMFVLFADGQTTGFVETHDKSTPGAHEITVKKVNASQDIAGVALPGTKMVFFSNGHPEDSGATEPRVESYDKVTNHIQAIRDAFKVTDKEAQNMSWFEHNGKRYLWYHGLTATAERFEMQRELSALLLPQGASLTDKNGAAIPTMHGMIPQIRAYGSTVEYLTRPDGASFDECILQLSDAYSDKKFFVGHGINYMLGLKDYLVEFAKNGTGNISFSPFDGGEAQAISLNFKSYSVGAYEFYFNEWPILSHKDSLGADGLTFRHMAAFLPAGTTRNPDPERASGAPEYEPYIQLVSPQWGMPLPNIDKGDYLMWETGALAANGPTSDRAHKMVHMLAYDSFELRCRNKFLLHEIGNP